LPLPPEPSHALQFLFDPIKQQFQKQPSSVLQTTQRLSILEARFKLRIDNSDGSNLDGTPLSADFTLWEYIQHENPQDLARSYTESVTRLFSPLSFEDIRYGGPNMKNIREEWSNYSGDVYACLSTDGKLADSFIELAEVLHVQSIVYNIHH
jgi:hypothetical protein